jgi:hypothetical protein
MHVVNAILNPLFDLLQGLFAGLPAWIGVLVWSIPLGVFALVVFKWTSNQERIAAVKQSIAAALFEIRLFNDDLRSIMRAQGEILRHVVVYQALALKPMIFILPPLVLVMVQLHMFYGFRTPSPNEPVLLQVQLAPAAPGAPRPPVELIAPEGVVVDTPGVWAADLGQITWRIRVTQPGVHDLTIRDGDQSYTKTLTATDRIVRLSPTRPDSSFFGQLEWPSEAPLPPASPVREISVGYPDAHFDALVWSSDWRYAWMVVFFVLTMVVALALKKPLGVEL